jgi:septal ring factor EnvC (AmiA/AmiB activator)
MLRQWEALKEALGKEMARHHRKAHGLYKLEDDKLTEKITSRAMLLVNIDESLKLIYADFERIDRIDQDIDKLEGYVRRLKGLDSREKELYEQLADIERQLKRTRSALRWIDSLDSTGEGEHSENVDTDHH